MGILIFAICYFASAIGGVCGIGGGVVIKPVLDALGVMDVSSISFLSGLTVLSMSVISVFRQRGSHQVELRTGSLLAAGAVAGGIVGNFLFQQVKALAGQDEFANNGISNYLFRHVLPLIILLVAAVILFVIHVRERRAENEAYDRLTREIYKKHAKEEGVMGQEEWEELLNKYAEGSGLKGTRKEDA